MKNRYKITISGLFFYYIFPIRKSIIFANIHRVFHKTLTYQEQIDLIKAFYSHFATTLKELILMHSYRREAIDQLVEVKGIENLIKAKKKNKGCLLISGHLGNWEFASMIALSRLKPTIGSVNVIRRQIRLKWLEKIIFNRVQRYGLKRIDKHGGARKIVQALNGKEIVAFAFDQHANLKNKEGLAVNFFGEKAGTFRSLAYFAHKFQAPVVPVSIYRTPNGKHVFDIHPELDWEYHSNEEQAIYINTVRYNQVLEKFILAHPEQWWWVHRRWKL